MIDFGIVGFATFVPFPSSRSPLADYLSLYSQINRYLRHYENVGVTACVSNVYSRNDKRTHAAGFAWTAALYRS